MLGDLVYDKWRSWIQTCVFSGNLLVLVNGSLTDEVNIYKGLKKGDPLSPFFFHQLVERLGGLIRTTVSQNCFIRFKVGSLVEILHLQYVDDNISIGDPSKENS